MDNLSDSFTKFVTKIGEVGRKNEKGEKGIVQDKPRMEEHQGHSDPPSPKPPPRPGSPFILLLTEGEEEFHYNNKNGQSDRKEPNTREPFDDSALGSSTSLDKIAAEASAEQQTRLNESMNVPMLPDRLDGTLEMSSGENDSTSSDSSDEAAMMENDTLRSHRSTPLTKEMFDAMFDHSGRLIQEHELRKIIFKGGVEDSIRKDVWKFLFELYPFNSTAREREVLKVENTVRYEAMKIRWKKILKTLVDDYEGVRYCPKWYSGCPTSAMEREKAKAMYLESCVESNEESDMKNDSINQTQLDTTPVNSTCLCSFEEDGKEEIYVGEHQKHFDSSSQEKMNTENSSYNGIVKDTHDQDHRLIDSHETKDGLECKEIENISDALADAMRDCEQDNTSTKKNTSISSGGSPTPMDGSVLVVDNERYPVTPDYLCPEQLSPRDLKDDMIHVTNDSFLLNKDRDVEDGASYREKRFPNPFTLPAEYINTQESLYSQSENIEPLDLYSFDTKSSNHNAIEQKITPAASSGDSRGQGNVVPDLAKKSSADTNKSLPKLTEQTVSSTFYEGQVDQDYAINATEYTVVIDSSSEKSDNCTPKLKSPCEITDATETPNIGNTITGIPPVCHIDVDTKHTYNRHAEDCCNGTTEPHSSGGFCNNIENVTSLENPVINKSSNRSNINNNTITNEQKEDDLTNSNRPTNSSGKSVPTPSSTPQPIKIPGSNAVANPITYVNPPVQSLEKLSPWVAQMVKASTPTGRREKTRFEVDVEEFKQKEKEQEDILRQQRQEQEKLDQELLGIVHNANKFVEESIKKNISGHTTPKLSNTSPEMEPKVKKDKVINTETIPDSSFMSPLPPSEVDVFLSDTPSLKLVSETNFSFDDVDFSPKKTSACPYCSFQSDVSTKLVLTESLGEDQLKFMEIQAQVFAARQPYDDKNISESIRVIDKDVPRTDRELEMFSGDSNPGLLKLRDALLTYAFFHPDVGYAQGMNDIMSRFMFVMDSEVEAYWMFVNYMEYFKNDFMEAGMLRKIALVEQLLMKMDRELYDYLQSMDMGLIFCHRWLLLNFKREFDYIEAIRLFEITSSRHLEVSSLEAEIERSKERAKEFVKDSAGSHMEEVFLSPEYPFDIFVCVAMLMECRKMIIDTEDITTVYTLLSNLPTTLELQNILRRSEELFYRYCRKTTVDCFQIIDDLEVPDLKKKKITFPFSFGQL